MAVYQTISPEDMNLVLVTDDIDETIQHISKYIKQNYKMKPAKALVAFERT